jgi:hypothetical protein
MLTEAGRRCAAEWKAAHPAEWARLRELWERRLTVAMALR